MYMAVHAYCVYLYFFVLVAMSFLWFSEVECDTFL